MLFYLRIHLIVFLFMLSNCRKNEVPQSSYVDDIFYEVWIKSFADSDDPDAIGDIRGIIDKLDYLNDGNPGTQSDLGITGIKLSPIFDCGYKSRDPAANMHGYDVTNYDSVNEIFGDRHDVKQLIKAAHARNIKVLFDFVPNHTSSKHTWFLEARDRDAKRNWYVWDSNPDSAWQRPWGGGSWQDVWFPYKDSYYYSAFQFNTLPDLNYKNPEVREEIVSIIKYWLDFGFDGFRIDAARYLMEDGPGLASDRPGTHDFLQRLRRITDGYIPPRFMVAEILAPEESITSYFGNGHNELHLCYNFPFAWHVREAIEQQDVSGLRKLISFQQAHYPDGHHMANLLNNHDNINSRPFSVYRGDLRRCLLAAAVNLFSEGTPFIYYGNEIGLVGKRGQDQFADIALRKYFNWESAEKQRRDPHSLWNWYRRLIELRKQLPVLRRGSYELVPLNDKAIFCSYRQYNGEKLLMIFNFSDSTKQISYRLSRINMKPHSINKLIVPEKCHVSIDDTLIVNPLMPFAFILLYSGNRGKSDQLTYPDTISGGADPPALPRFSYNTMYLRGTMNQWQGTMAMHKNRQGMWEAEPALSPGTYQFKFEVGGRAEWEINWGDENDDGIGEIEGPPMEFLVKEKGNYLFRFNEKDYSYHIIRRENHKP